jgi:hypothetical protein
VTAVIEEVETEVIPGVYDIPAELYHRDPVPGGSLSSSGARKLLPPGCPAKFKYALEHEQKPKAIFEIGTAAHKLVLGNGPDLVRIDADEWRSNAVKAEVATVRAAGAVPLKPADYQRVHDMADVLASHPYASELLAPDSGDAEQTLIWQDGETGIWRRARLDWFRHDGRVIDYKSAVSADLDAVEKHIHDYGYHMQADWYLDGVHALGLNTPRTDFTFVIQEKEPPYVITITDLDAVELQYARARNREAIDTYAHCRETGHWHAYSDRPTTTALPSWIERQYLESIK